MVDLLGRTVECARIDRGIDRLREVTSHGPGYVGESVGSTVILVGAPGIGKSALLAHAEARARAAGLRVMKSACVESETTTPFSGAHQLAHPVLNAIEDKLPEQARLLRSVVDAAYQRPIAVARVGMALLDVMSELAASSPIVVLIDDAHWLDTSSWEALGFAARRWVADPVLAVVTVRDFSAVSGPQTDLVRWAGPTASTVEVAPLEPEAANELLDRCAADMQPDLRARILTEAAGNPLALVELPRAVTELVIGRELPDQLPLTARLEREFASRLSFLPEAARALLLVAAADDRGELSEILSAASAMVGAPVTTADVAPGIDIGLVTLAGGVVDFTHPLMRSAVYQAAGAARRREAHAALASVLTADLSRRVAHRLRCTVGADRDLTSNLLTLAHNHQAAGDPAAAIAALERAAEFAESPARRAELLLRAADLSLLVGRPADAARLAPVADAAHLDAGGRVKLGWIREVLGAGEWTGEQMIMAHVDMAERLQEAGEADAALSALAQGALRMWWSNPAAASCARVAAAAEHMASGPEDLRLMVVLAATAPVERGREVRKALAQTPLPAATGGPVHVQMLGLAQAMVGDHARALEAFRWGCDICRRTGQLGLLSQLLVSVAWAQLIVGQVRRAETTAAEALERTQESGEPLWEATAALATALVAARRGEGDRAHRLLGPAETVLLHAGANPMLAMVQFVRGAAALSAGRHSEAFDQLARVFDPHDIAYHRYYGGNLAADLVDAAVHSGRREELDPLLARLEDEARRGGAPVLVANLAFAGPLLRAEDRPDTDDFDAALAELAAWPVLHARTLLAYGSWLRRHHRAVEARARLRAASETFTALGLPPWADQARHELRAAGEHVVRPAPTAWDALTGQERQVAALAAEGLSNKEIADRVFLSHRTVSTHLYRIFPKVGVTSRAQLAALFAHSGELTD